MPEEYKHEDKFKSVRENGPNEGTEVEAVDEDVSTPEAAPVVNIVPEATQNVGWPHRSVEQVLRDMRRVLTDKRIENPLLNSLITEAEIYCARMTATIEDFDSYDSLKERYDELVEEKKAIQPTRGDD